MKVHQPLKVTQLPELSLFLEVDKNGRLTFTELKKNYSGYLTRKKKVHGVADNNEVSFHGYEFF